MDIHKRALRTVLATVCACSAVAGIGMAAAPGSALAAVNCAAITGSGSSLQAEQQSSWTTQVGTSGFKLFTGTEECNPANPKITYTATSSGKGLAEWGVGSKKLAPKESGNGSTLDGYIGTDDPPTAASLTEMKEASGSNAWTIPIVSAPIAVIMHLPTGCEISGTAFHLPGKLLETIWLGVLTFEEVLLEITGLTVTEKTTNACKVTSTLEVRADSSGTSYAFKQYLCQIEPTGWGNVAGECESGDGFVTDAATWPATVSKEHEEGGKKVLNEGSKGEANAVKETPGSFGYVNEANAVAAGIEPYGTGAGQSSTLFWAQVEGPSTPTFAEPVKNTTEANCPETFTFPSGAVKTEAEKGEWSKVHLAKLGQTGGFYPICTFTYDVGWENYLTTELEKEYGGATKAGEVGNTTLGYFEYMTEKGQEKANIAPYYGPLPTGSGSVGSIATKIAKTKIG